MRLCFDEQLKKLDNELSLMGAMCEEAIATAAEAVLRGGDEALKKKRPIWRRAPTGRNGRSKACA